MNCRVCNEPWRLDTPLKYHDASEGRRNEWHCLGSPCADGCPRCLEDPIPKSNPEAGPGAFNFCKFCRKEIPLPTYSMWHIISHPIHCEDKRCIAHCGDCSDDFAAIGSDHVDQTPVVVPPEKDNHQKFLENLDRSESVRKIVAGWPEK